MAYHIHTDISVYSDKELFLFLSTISQRSLTGSSKWQKEIARIMMIKSDVYLQNMNEIIP